MVKNATTIMETAMKALTVLAVLALTVSCGQGNKRLEEKATLESKSQLNVENGNLAQKAEKMEKDLAKRHRFYQAIKGVYEGVINTDLGTFSIRITLTPTLAPLEVNRVRQLDEIASDLNTLSLNTQVVQWDPNNPKSAVGCRVSGIRPDVERGEIAIAAESCSNLYIIKLTEQESNGTPSTNSQIAARIAKQVLDGDLKEVSSVNGTIQPSTNASVFKFAAIKVQE